MSPTIPPRSSLETPHGTIEFPAYVPVTTFGEKYPLDDLVRPYLPRLASAMMVSLHYAKQMQDRPPFPLLIDSGGFASLFKEFSVREHQKVGLLEHHSPAGLETTHPRDVLHFQEEYADIGFSLDFPIPPSMERSEASLRQRLTIANALWALKNRRRTSMRLFACVQGWDVDSYQTCAQAYVGQGFDGLAIGGLVPRMRNQGELFKIVDRVRETDPTVPLHVFGLGKPALVQKLFARGVQSVDSSSYVKMAADGKLWGQSGPGAKDISPTERLHLALCNLATATQSTMPLSSAPMMFRTRGLGSIRPVSGTG